METNIELSKTRDFGEIISDSFLFIRQNLKPLLSCFFVFCGFFLLAGAAASIMQQIRLSAMIENPDFGGTSGGTTISRIFSRTLGVDGLLAILFSLLMYTIMPVTILSYMAVYKQKGNIAPTNEEVWGYVKYYFFKIFGITFLNFIILIIGFVFCLIPGIYFYPILGLILPIVIVENTSYSYAFSQSFRLIKENWWMVFGALFITGIIVSVCSAMVTAPFAVVNMWSTFLHKVKHVHLSVISIVMGTILKQLAHAFYILPLVTLAICYFSLTEAKDATGLMDRINQLGDNTSDTNTPAEEY